jgi:hypothetical protein
MEETVNKKYDLDKNTKVKQVKRPNIFKRILFRKVLKRIG